MKNLYDILDARPDDDAETLKLAFRKAVKTCHPDLNLDDPDALTRFRELVRAKAILCDPQLRAAYDRMLEFESGQLRRTSGYSATRSILSDAIGVVLLAVVLAGAYTTFTYISDKPVAKNKTDVVVSTHQPANVTAALVPSPVATADTRSAREQFDDAEAPLRIIENTVNAFSSNELGADVSVYAKFLHERGIASYHNGDMSSAITNFDLAIRLDPDFKRAYIDRSIALYRIHEVSRAFADIGQARRIENSRRAVTPSAGETQ